MSGNRFDISVVTYLTWLTSLYAPNGGKFFFASLSSNNIISSRWKPARTQPPPAAFALSLT